MIFLDDDGRAKQQRLTWMTAIGSSAQGILSSRKVPTGVHGRLLFMAAQSQNSTSSDADVSLVRQPA